MIIHSNTAIGYTYGKIHSFVKNVLIFKFSNMNSNNMNNIKILPIINNFIFISSGARPREPEPRDSFIHCQPWRKTAIPA